MSADIEQIQLILAPKSGFYKAFPIKIKTKLDLEGIFKTTDQRSNESYICISVVGLHKLHHKSRF